MKILDSFLSTLKSTLRRVMAVYCNCGSFDDQQVFLVMILSDTSSENRDYRSKHLNRNSLRKQVLFLSV